MGNFAEIVEGEDGVWRMADNSNNLPPGFPPGFAEHRRQNELGQCQVCAEKNCPHCMAYGQFMEREN